MPAQNFGKHLSRWKKGGRKACKSDKQFIKMEGDLHNLQFAIGEVNADRSNLRFGMIQNPKPTYCSCNFHIDYDLDVAMPKQDIRGNIARSYFYMSHTYGIKLSDKDLKLLSA